jgi:hypothetical protein
MTWTLVKGHKGPVKGLRASGPQGLNLLFTHYSLFITVMNVYLCGPVLLSSSSSCAKERIPKLLVNCTETMKLHTYNDCLVCVCAWGGRGDV